MHIWKRNIKCLLYLKLEIHIQPHVPTRKNNIKLSEYKPLSFTCGVYSVNRDNVCGCICDCYAFSKVRKRDISSMLVADVMSSQSAFSSIFSNYLSCLDT